MGNKKYRKQIKSFKKLIEEHIDKIEVENSKIVPNPKLIKYWKKEVEKFEQELVKSEKRLKKRR